MRSWIQDHALSVLIRREEANIKDMRPVDVPANLFSYHLEGLVSEKVIVKTHRGKYQLTPLGKRLAGLLSTSTRQQSDNLKTVIVLYGKTDDGKVLLFRWSRQPYLNKVTLAMDRAHFGDTLEQSVKEATLDKLGKEMSATYLKSLIVKVENEGVLVSHMNALIYAVDLHELKLPLKVRNGEIFIADLDSVDGAVQGLSDLLECIDNANDAVIKEYILSY